MFLGKCSKKSESVGRKQKKKILLYESTFLYKLIFLFAQFFFCFNSRKGIEFSRSRISQVKSISSYLLFAFNWKCCVCWSAFHDGGVEIEKADEDVESVSQSMDRSFVRALESVERTRKSYVKNDPGLTTLNKLQVSINTIKSLFLSLHTVVCILWMQQGQLSTFLG